MEGMDSAAPRPREEEAVPRNPPDDYTSTSRKSKFRFKSSSSRSKRHRRSSSPERRQRSHYKSSSDSTRHRRQGDSSRSSKRYHSSRSTTSHTQPDLDEQTNRARGLSPEAAFRESLFDALGDDEGAAYWESVYGQPIHNYAVPEVPKGPEGELEQMSDEEYASYVRARMWERTREGMIEEQERLRAERRKQKAQEDNWRERERERAAFDRAMDDSLRRGRERVTKRRLQEVWPIYISKWEEVAKAAASASASAAQEGNHEGAKPVPLRNLLHWPVESGKRRDVEPDAVRRFMRDAPSEDLMATLKAERVRWHPDKIQHRYSVLGIDDVVMRSVTEVFQIVDRMWNEERERTG